MCCREKGICKLTSSLFEQLSVQDNRLSQLTTISDETASNEFADMVQNSTSSYKRYMRYLLMSPLKKLLLSACPRYNKVESSISRFGPQSFSRSFVRR
jgi:hypothetical protein